MRIKFGSLAVSGSGSLGGHTIQHSHGGCQLRNKPISSVPRSVAQSLIRSFNPLLQAGWRALSDSQRLIWNNYALIKPVFNLKDDHLPLSGHSLWMKYQFGRLAEGLPFLSDPSGYKTQYLGPELIINGDFTSSAGWIIGAGWTISGGYGNFLDTQTATLKRSCSLVSGATYRLKFDILFSPGLSYMLFVNELNTAAFISPYHNYSPRANGSYTIYPVASGNHSQFGFRGHIAQSSFSLDNISLKIFL